MENVATERFTELEHRVLKAAEEITRLRESQTAAHTRNEALVTEINHLKSRNNDLSKQIDELKLNEEQRANSFNKKEEVRKRIDLLLEKFAELQL